MELHNGGVTGVLPIVKGVHHHYLGTQELFSYSTLTGSGNRDCNGGVLPETGMAFCSAAASILFLFFEAEFLNVLARQTSPQSIGIQALPS